METVDLNSAGLFLIQEKEAKFIDGGILLINPIGRLVKFILGASATLSENWEEYQEGYWEGYNDAG